MMLSNEHFGALFSLFFPSNDNQTTANFPTTFVSLSSHLLDDAYIPLLPEQANKIVDGWREDCKLQVATSSDVVCLSFSFLPCDEYTQNKGQQTRRITMMILKRYFVEWDWDELAAAWITKLRVEMERGRTKFSHYKICTIYYIIFPFCWIFSSFLSDGNFFSHSRDLLVHWMKMYDEMIVKMNGIERCSKYCTKCLTAFANRTLDNLQRILSGIRVHYCSTWDDIEGRDRLIESLV